MTEEKPAATYLEQAIAMATETKERKIYSLVGLGVFGLLYLIFFICEGVYGFGGPDPVHAFYIPGVDTPAITLKGSVTLANDLQVTIKDGYPVDMAKVFRAWFAWGFWGSFIQICIVGAYVPLTLYTKENPVKRMAFLSAQGLATCSTVFWYLMGWFWRYSAGGRIVAGEQLERASDVSDSDWKI